ncbi:MAG: HTTM domain-containing protein [Myxococcota bacterium]
MNEGVAPAGLRWWFPSVPADRLSMLRLLVGLYSVIYLAIRLRHLMSFANYQAVQFQPVGPLAWMKAPFDPTLFRILVVLTFATSIAFFVGWAYRVTAPIFGVLLLVVLTYANCWGGILHSENLWLIHVLILACAPAAATLSLDARSREPAPSPHFKYGWAIRLMCWVCVATYFLAGLAKLKNGGLGFIEGESLRNYVALDSVRKIELGSLHSPISSLLLPYASVFQGLAMFSLVLELGAPLVMLQEKVAKVWAFLMWGFHLGVLALMAILFSYPVAFIAFAPFFRTERLAAWVRRVILRVPNPTAPAPSPG